MKRRIFLPLALCAAAAASDYAPVYNVKTFGAAGNRGLSIEGFSAVWDTSGATPERHMIFGDRLEDAHFNGLAGGALGGLEAVKIVNSKKVVLK